MLFLNKILFVALVLEGCIPSYCAAANSRSQLHEMKDELMLAQKKLVQQRAYVENLEEKIACDEIALIRKEISQIEKRETAKKVLSHDEWLAFFSHQRETLSQIIRKHPACRTQAQEVLDQILTLITQLSDQIEN